MKKILLFMLLFSIITNAQVIDSIKTTANDFTPIVVNLEQKTNQEIYSKVKSWINRFYKNPEFIIKADEKDTYLRFYAASSFSFKYMGTTTYDYQYNVEIEIKDNKYKIQFVSVTFYNKNLPQFFYDKKGNFKGKSGINKKMFDALLSDINRIHFDLYNFITSKKEDW